MKRQSVLGRVLRLFLAAYQRLLSPWMSSLFGASCRFVPSCSEYASEALDRYGVIGGGWLVLRRLARCHPLGSHGYDPCPAAREAKLTQPEGVGTGTGTFNMETPARRARAARSRLSFPNGIRH